MVCPTSDVSPTVMVIVQTLADVTLLEKFRSSGASRILRKSELCIHVVHYTFIYKGNTVEVQNLTHRNVTGSSMIATLSVLSPNSILSTPACHYVFIPRGNVRRVVNKCYYSKYIYFFKNCVILNYPNLKLLQSWSVCSDFRLCWLFNDGIN